MISGLTEQLINSNSDYLLTAFQAQNVKTHFWMTNFKLLQNEQLEDLISESETILFTLCWTFSGLNNYKQSNQ